MRERRLSEKEIAGRLSYQESQADHFERLGIGEMARWCRKEADGWRRKLEEFQRGSRPTVAGD